MSLFDDSEQHLGREKFGKNLPSPGNYGRSELWQRTSQLIFACVLWKIHQLLSKIYVHQQYHLGIVDVPPKPQPIRIPGSPSPEEVYLGWQHHPAILHLFCRRWRTFFSQRKGIIFQPSIFKGMLIPPFKNWDPYMGYMNPLGWRLTSLFAYYMDMHITGWWFQIFLEFSPRKLGKMNPFWLIFFNWV